MDNIKDIINISIDIYQIISSEIEQNNALKEIFTDDLPLYKKSIKEIQNISEDIDNVQESKLLEHRTIDFLIMEHINSGLKKHKKFIENLNKWYNQNKCLYIFKACCCEDQRTVSITSKLHKYLLEVQEYLEKIVKLKRSIFGSGFRIEHPILRKAWLLVGENQLNDSSITYNLISDNIYQLLKNEIGEIDLKIWKDKIDNLIKLIDESCISDNDSKISIIELNNISKELLQYKNIYELLNNVSSEESTIIPVIQNKKKLEPHTQLIKYNLENNIVINSSTKNKPLEKCSGYGSDFPAAEICKIKVPKIDVKGDYKLIFANFEINATDQGWGGTGHVQVRYKINDGDYIHAFNVNRDKNPNNNYTFNIKGSDIKVNDVIEFVLLCPIWNGWKATVSSIKGKLCYE